MTAAGWAEILATIALAVALAWPAGAYLSRIWSGQRTWLDPVLAPVEALFHRLAGVDPRKPQNWSEYALSLLAFNAAGFAALYLLLRLQGLLPLNPQGLHGLSPDAAFDTALSFVTNTDWQSGRAAASISQLSALAGLVTQNFVSAASGIAVAAALTRAFSANRSHALGNFWVDLVRAALYFLLPIAVGMSLVLVALGSPQTLADNIQAHGLEGGVQVIAIGPVASQQAINQIGTNGASVFWANAAHPFANPTPLSNLIEAAVMDATGLACVVAFGRTLRARADARALVAAMTLMVAAASAIIYWGETRPPPALAAAHADADANMEGKEVRFGAPGSAVFTAMTTGSSAGSVNAMVESLAPVSSGVALFLMELGEMLPGGAGTGLLSIVMMSLLAMLVAGLMVGRTPEYLGKKIERREIKLVLLGTLLMSLSILGFSALAAVTPAALAGLSATGPHGLMEMLYAYASTTANNGSAFQGLRADNAYWNITLGVAMAIGRYGFLMPVLALAGGLAAKPRLLPSEGTLPTDGPLFVGLLLSVILILAGLQYFPSLALGPMAEQLELTHAGRADARRRAIPPAWSSIGPSSRTDRSRTHSP